METLKVQKTSKLMPNLQSIFSKNYVLKPSRRIWEILEINGISIENVCVEEAVET